jgi:hypothetical protein
MHALVHTLAVAGLGAALSLSLTGPSIAAPCAPLNGGQARVVEKADLGVDARRRYVYITRSMHQLDMMEIADPLDSWRERAACAKQVAAPTPTTQLTALAVTPF